MLRDVFYFGKKPNAHPRERHASNLEVARYLATTDHFWIINEFCDYNGFDWDFDFDTLPDDEVWTERHDNVWPSQHQKDSGTWLCNKNYTDVTYYRTDVKPVHRKNIKNDCWEIIHPINESSFDFSWHPDPTEPPYIYRWGCKYFPPTQGPVVQYTVPGATQFKYIDTVVELVPNWSRWKILHDIELDSFDFCWAPDPASPPYIYVFGNQHYDAIKMPTIEYHMPGAEERKYVKAAIFTPKLKQHPERFEHLEDSHGIDYSWVPDPDSGPYIYAWGNQWNKPEDKISIQYAVQGATTYTYMGERAIRRPCKDNWEIPKGLDTTKFDFSWEPSPAEPPFIYQFGTQWQKTNGPRYVVQGATEIKYIDATVAKRLPNKSNWEIPDNIDADSFDYSWHPDDTDPPFIYQFGTQHQKTNGPRYVVQGATEIKYVDSVKAKILPNKDNWETPDNIDTSEFDYSWHPDDTETPYIYQFGTQHQKTDGPRYVVCGATEIKYVEGSKAKMLPDKSKFDISNCAVIDIENFDYSWHPDSTEVPYIYQFGTQHQKTGGPIYVVEGATEIKYVETVKATALVDLSRWDTNTDTSTDLSSFDFSWHPDTTEVPYIYQFGTQHQKTGGPRYIVPGATDIKYIDSIKVKAVVSVSNWQVDDNVPFDNLKFDFSWHPDSTEVPYIYQFGTQHQKTGGPRYVVPGATDISYVEGIKVIALPTSQRWEVVTDYPLDFDYSWHPDNTDDKYIYVFGNQHYSAEKMPTVRYVIQGATEFKYINDVVATIRPDKSRFRVHTPIDENKFDFTWVPDPGNPPYIYVWGNKHVPAELGPTVEYYVDGAVGKNFVHNDVSVLPEFDRWNIIDQIDRSKFDFTWRPDPTAPPYIYAWGSKHVDAETSPAIEYIVPDATEYKFMQETVEVLPRYENFFEVQKIDRSKFDFTWRPNPKEPPFIYAWGNKHVPVEIKSTLEYRVPGATDYKYMHDIEVLSEMQYWHIFEEIDKTKFDLSWRPDPREPAYIYVWGNKHVPGELQSTIEYHCPGATEKKYMDEPAPVLPQHERWTITQEIDKDKFDLSWRPDPREPPFIYVWGNKYIPGEKRPTLTYHTPGATEYKYLGDVEVLPEWDRWVEHVPIDKERSKLSGFDFSWRPDPSEPPFIYVWGNKYFPGELRPTLEYHCDGASQKKYMPELIELQPDWERWEIIQRPSNFDFSWTPDPREPPYIYVWGNKYIPGEKLPTLKYVVSGATEYKYMSNDIAVEPEWNKWKILVPVDKDSFDFSWRPDPDEPPFVYVWGNQYNSAEVEPTIEYHCDEAYDQKKYMHDKVAKTLPESDNWKILIPIEDFDFSWRPDPGSPPYIYVFGNQWNDAVTEPTVQYYIPGATEYSYIYSIKAKVAPSKTGWEIKIPIEDFDFSWRPNPYDPPYIYQFGTQHQKTGGPRYIVPGATDVKYVDTIKARALPRLYDTNWCNVSKYEIGNFDYSWHPDYSEPPFIYVFGNQWNPVEIEPAIEYRVPGSTDYKYMDIVARLQPIPNDPKWKNIIPIEDFDYSWVPDPREPPMIYVFGNKWNDANTEPSVEYHMPDTYERKYMKNIVATPIAEMKYWSITNSDDLDTFDFSWRPNPYSPPQIYQWEDNGPRYTVPGATDVVYMKREIKEKTQRKDTPKYYITTTLEDLIKQHSDEVFWALNPDMNYDSFDFNWKPNSENFRHINVFGSEYAKDTQTYYINGPMYTLGYCEYNYIEDVKVEATTTKLTMFYIDRGNSTSNKHFADLQKRYPNIIRTRYLNSWVDTINRCIRKSDTNLFWVLNSEYDYTDFKFNFYPSPWQMKMVHVFGTQWSHWGHTYLINGETFIEDTKYVRIIEHLNCLNFVKNQKAKATDCLYDIYLIDHGNFESSFIHSELVSKYDNVKVTLVPHRETYLETFKDILAQAEDKNENFIWITNSVCGYDDFDFSYICDPFAKEQLHVFPSDKQKYGDTFLVNIDRLREQVEKMISLDDYDKINFNTHQSTNRLEAPEIVVEADTHTEIIQKLDFEFPYVILKTRDNSDIRVKDDEPISLWSKRSKTITVTTSGASRIILPKEAKKYVKNELYDYPHIEEKIKKQSKPLDIVFLSNGETNADENYEHLLKITKGLPNRVVRVDGVNGRVQAYHAAAEASNTNWLFTVFAKLKVDKDFDFSWQPDRLRKPKHYIFQAKNPLNGLVYGHQAMIAYNKKLTLANTGKGLDFTLDDLHDSIEILSGIAEFNTDAYSTWRTAFREVIKLKSDYETVSADRLKIWLSTAEGNFAQDCLRGARDAINYYNEVDGDIDQLKLSYEWEWLKDYYDKKYK